MYNESIAILFGSGSKTIGPQDWYLGYWSSLQLCGFQNCLAKWHPSWSCGQANLSKVGELDSYHFRHSNPSLHFRAYKSICLYVFFLYHYIYIYMYLYIRHKFEQVYAIWIQYMQYVSLGWAIFPWVCETSRIDWVATVPSKAYGSEEGLVLGKRRATGAGRSTPSKMVWFEMRIFFVKNLVK